MSYNRLDADASNNPFEDDLIIEDDVPAQPEVPQAVPIVPDTPSYAQPAQKNTFEGGYFSINHYRQYFDLNTSDFFRNCYKSINPFNKMTTEELFENGDLYGSVWITGTLIFLLFVCSSLSEILADWVFKRKAMNENYFALLVRSINLLYGYVFVIPALLYLVLRFYFKILSGARISKFISVYSYSSIWWIPAAVISVLGGLFGKFTLLSIILRWSLVGAGGLLSGFSIFIKLIPVLVSNFNENDKKGGYVLIAILLLCHVGFTVGVKVSFFGTIV